MNRIKKDDLVQVMSGKDRGRQGRVLKVVSEESSAVVEGAGVVKKHQKASQNGGPSGIIEKNVRLPLAKLMPIDPKTKKPTRVRFEVRDGSKVRIAVKSGEILDSIGKKKKA